MAPIIVKQNRTKLTDDQIAASRKSEGSLFFVKLGLAALKSEVSLSERSIKLIKEKAAEVTSAMKGGSPER